MSHIWEVGKIKDYGFSNSFETPFPRNKLSVESNKKWMRLAKAVKEVENPCHSRQIGVILVDPDTDALISSGHNGPPSNCPKNDDPSYLENVVWPQLSEQEKAIVSSKLNKEVDACLFAKEYGNCKTCPRKHIDAPSGKRLELCTCIHGETDAIVKAKGAGSRVAGSYMYAYCGVPCIECTKLIINSSIDTVIAINHGHGDYSPYSSRWLFEKSRVNLILVKEEWIWNDEK